MGLDDNESNEVNASGHAQELERQFGLLSVSAIGIVTGCSWALMGGTIVGPSPNIFLHAEVHGRILTTWYLGNISA